MRARLADRCHASALSTTHRSAESCAFKCVTKHRSAGASIRPVPRLGHTRRTLDDAVQVGNLVTNMSVEPNGTGAGGMSGVAPISRRHASDEGFRQLAT